MNEILSQYYQRSPRYILIPQDECLIRVAGPKQTPWEEGTEILNISNTGLCFTAPEILLPRHGEYIRVQFDVPGSQQMACHAKVVRIERLNPEMSLVGIEFESLNPSQQWNLSRGLKKKRVKEPVIEVTPGVAMPQWLEYVFYGSVSVSLFFSAFLLFVIYRYLSDPFWMDKLMLILQSLWGKLLS